MHIKNSVLSYLEDSTERNPQSCAVIDVNGQYTYEQLLENSKRIGSALAHLDVAGHGVVVAMDKGMKALSTMLGILYAGGFYVPIDPSTPPERLNHILAALDDPYVIVDSMDMFPSLNDRDDIDVIHSSSLAESTIDEILLDGIRASMVETQPAYVLFTSGSTGVPKGVAVSHRAVISFIDAFTETFGIDSNDRIGNQAPFDFDVSTKDIYSALSTGATLVIIPRELFMQPVPLVDYLSDNDVTILIWAVAALCIVTAYHALDGRSLPKIRKVLFSGEVMPLAHLAEWEKCLPQAEFANLYGPTEITCNCLYHKVDRNRDYADGIPLGTNFSHCHVMIVDKTGHEVTEPGVEGEIVVGGPSLSLGYIGMEETTNRVFTQNPLHDRYPDRVYHTGDLASYSKDGDLYFRGRKDNQIKYMGHRIELEEIDRAFEELPGIARCRCVFDSDRKRLRAFYEGSASKKDILSRVRNQIPAYMRPSSIDMVTSMPLNKNGKVDRALLFEMSRYSQHQRKAVNQ